ncbi:hypothetical protein [Rickettsiella endosymbiont of Dermanyssus gallinae]|uniref:hypothetical protein n=1 Tax=Rickettsiella endosymbiont of Dermanyssus gallinae TaxID=2856608 RepID=UPI001C52DC2B|nr:hypothetical protein [Rickettsiella endosymbiont of Dermanyssus gallinae]
MPPISQKLLFLFSSDRRQAIADGIITLERYLQIPSDERESMKYLFSSDGRQAVANGVITLEQYLQIPSGERESMKYLFSPDGRQAVAADVITLEQYRKIPWDDRYSMKYLFSPDGRQAVADGVITLEQYLQIPFYARDMMKCLFSPDGRQAVAAGAITLEQYQELPRVKCRNAIIALQDPYTRQRIINGQITIENILGIDPLRLLPPNWQQAIAEGVITLEQYRKIPRFAAHERASMYSLFSPDGRQAVAAGAITLEQYLQIPCHERDSMQYLFSPDGRRAVAEGAITLEQYLQVPRAGRQNVMIALQDPHTRRRIINRQITIETIIGINSRRHHADDIAVTPIFNDVQSTHTASVHESVAKSATRLAKLYKLRIDGAGLENTIGKAQAYINSLPDDSEKNKAAQRGFSRILAPDYTFTDPSSQVSTRKLLALAFLAIHDGENRFGSLEDAEMQFVEALYEIQRGYNLSDSGVDEGGTDQYICPPGAFNKLIEKLQGIHPDCKILYLTEETASFKLPIIVREEAMRYLATFANPNTSKALLAFTRLMAQIKEEGVKVIWDHIKNNITTRMFDDFGSLYRDRIDPNFTALVEAGKYAKLEDLSTFQEQVQKNYLSKHGSDGSKAQKQNITNPEKTLIYTQINLQLDKLENKANNLRDRDHILAYCKANNIVLILRDLNRDYFIDEKINYNTYKKKSFEIINQQRPELDKHRGYKQILGNLLIFIATLGAGQLVNKACNGNFLFSQRFFKTDSAKYIDKLSNMIEKPHASLHSFGGDIL